MQWSHISRKVKRRIQNQWVQINLSQILRGEIAPLAPPQQLTWYGTYTLHMCYIQGNITYVQIYCFFKGEYALPR